MKNTHIEHPEDSILTGDLSVLDWFTEPGHISLKIDGSPAIVWGINPATSKFFVGTKSVFNKKLIKINENHRDIDRNHSGVVADILHACFDNLPRIYGVIQGDFIGFGGSDSYCPNTITYVFEETVKENIIVAPHTFYSVLDGDCLRDAEAHPLKFMLQSSDKCKFVQPEACYGGSISDAEEIEQEVRFLKGISHGICFVDDKEAKRIKKELNACIREDREVDDYAFGCHSQLIRFWKLVSFLKMKYLELCYNQGPLSYIGEDLIDAEGYVKTNSCGMFKLVDRSVFSRANFNNRITQ